jgi:hypothetical protein
MSNSIAYETEAKLLHGQKFVDKVKDISKKLGINPSWLMETMNGESGLNPQNNPKAVNWITDPVTGKKKMFAVGLIQFIPSTLADWGLTPQEVYGMDVMKQLDLVYKFYNTFRTLLPKVKSYEDLHLLTFVPDGVGKPNDFKFPKSYTKQNKPMDINQDGFITVGEAKKLFRQRVNKKYLSLVLDIGTKVVTENKIPTILIVGTLFFLIYNHKKIKI